MVIVRGTNKAGQIIAPDGNANHFRRDPTHSTDLKQPPFGFVTEAAHGALADRRDLRHGVPFSVLVTDRNAQ
jgi:hypothetical protein